MNSVEQALNAPASELISAESSPATTSPRTPDRQHVLDHQREGRLALVAHRLAVARPGCVQARRSRCLARAKQIMPGMMKMNTGRSFMKAAAMLPRRAIGLVRRGQGPLHDVLVGTPVPQADDRGAEEHAQPGKLSLKYQAIACRSPCTGAQVPSMPAGTSGFQRLNISEPHDARAVRPSRRARSARTP